MLEPNTISELLCGQFGKSGLTLRDGLAFFKFDQWDNDVPPKHQRNNGGAPDHQNAGSPHDYAFFKGTHFTVSPSFTLPDVTHGGARGFGLARFDPDTQKWVGLLFDSEESSGNGRMLFVWDDGDGERLYVEMNTSDAPIGPKLKKCDYDPVTKVFTVANSPLADRPDGVLDWIRYDDGNGEEAYLLGTFDGLFPMSGSGPSISTRVTDACIHDFGDGLGMRLVAIGNNGIEAWNTGTSAWDQVGTPNLTFDNFTVGRIESHNGILWRVVGGAFQGLPRGTGQIIKTWVNAGAIVDGLDGASPLWRFFFNGGSNVRQGSAPNRLLRYGDKMAVAGGFDFRETLRNRIKSGPLVYYNPAATTWHRALPLVGGKVNVIIPYQGGVLVCGTLYASLANGVIIRGAGIWHDPGGFDNEGVWESIGEIEGEILDAVMYQNSLYIVGPISRAGGVAVDGIARRDSDGVWHRVVNISDYGTARTLLVANGKLIIAGDMFKVDGQAKFKIICTWDGFGLGTLVDDIQAADGLPFINDMTLSNGVVYVVGWFNRIEQPFAPDVTVRSVAQMGETTEAWTAMFDDDAPPEEGINNGRVAYAVGVADGQVYVGSDPDAAFGDTDFGTSGPVAKWNIGTPAWRPVNVDAFADRGRTLEIFSDAIDDKVLIHVHGISERGFSSTATHRIEEHSPRSFLGGEGNVSFSDQITALWRGSGGNIVRRWAGGAFDKVGAPLSVAASRIAGHIFLIDRDNKVVEAAGGLGVTAYDDQFTSTEFVLQMRLFTYPDPTQEAVTTTLKAAAHGWLDESEPAVPKHSDELLTLGRPVASKAARVVMSFGLGGITGEIISATLRLKGATPPDAQDTAKAHRLLTGFADLSVSWVNRNIRDAWANPGAGLQGSDRSGRNAAAFTMPVIQDSDLEIDVTEMVKDYITEHAEGRAPVFGIVLQDDDEASASINVWTLRKTAEIEIVYKPDSCQPTLVLAGFFPWTADIISEYLLPFDVHGRPFSMNGGLSGKMQLDQPGANVGVNCAVAIPRDRWPPEWLEVITRCQPNSRYVWLAGGSFSHGINDRIADENIGKVIEDIALDGIAIINGGHVFKVTKRPPRSYIRQIEVFDGKIITAGGLQPPAAYDDTVEPNGQWDFLMEQAVTGAILGGASATHRLLYFEDVLWLAGNHALHPTPGTTFGLLTWDGTPPYGIEEPVGFLRNTGAPEIGPPRGRCLAISNINGADQLYMGGRANTDQCPVVTRSPTGSWSAVGGASQLRGDCFNMAIIDRGVGKGYIIASGNFTVDEGAGFILTALVVFDGSSWKRAGFTDPSFLPRMGAAIAQNRPNTWCDDSGPFGIGARLGGQLIEIALDSGVIGTPASIPVHAAAQWQRSLDERWSLIPGTGVDGIVEYMAEANRLLYPNPVET